MGDQHQQERDDRRLQEQERQVARVGADELDVAAAEHAELTAFARRRSGDQALELRPWDLAFWAERQREELFSYTDEELRPTVARLLRERVGVTIEL